MTARKLLVASIALSGALFAGASQARTDWSVNIGLPLLLPPGVVVTAQPQVNYPAPYYHGARPVAPAYWERGDRDRDGIPNRYDRVDNRRYYDRDRDGIPNRHDRYDNRRWDRDGDGVPNGRDRNDHNPRRW